MENPLARRPRPAEYSCLAVASEVATAHRCLDHRDGENIGLSYWACSVCVAAREEGGLTQALLADNVGWTQTDISNVERGVRRLDLIEFLEFAKALGVDTQSFIGRLQRD